MRGVEAPFQLLVSVFTMILVVAIAFHVLRSVSTEHCEEQWRQSTADLAQAIVRAAMSEPPTTSSARLVLHCGSSGKHVFTFQELTGARCTHICQEVSDKCYVIYHQIYDVRGEPLYQAYTCLRNMSPYSYYLLRNGINSCPTGYSPLITDPTDMSFEFDGGVSKTVFVFRTVDGVALCLKNR